LALRQAIGQIKEFLLGLDEKSVFNAN